MNSTFLVGTKGQVTIAKEIRDKLGVKPGWRALQRVEAGRVVLEFLPPPHLRSLVGVLRNYSEVTIPSSEALEEASEEAFGNAAVERYRGQEIE
jgi:Regulators of stationary/sporulation gene expression